MPERPGKNCQQKGVWLGTIGWEHFSFFASL